LEGRCPPSDVTSLGQCISSPFPFPTSAHAFGEEVGEKELLEDFPSLFFLFPLPVLPAVSRPSNGSLAASKQKSSNGSFLFPPRPRILEEDQTRRIFCETCKTLLVVLAVKFPFPRSRALSFPFQGPSAQHIDFVLTSRGISCKNGFRPFFPFFFSLLRLS